MLGCVYGLDEDRTFVKAPGFEQRVWIEAGDAEERGFTNCSWGWGSHFSTSFLSYASACSL
jgi:hypothetical protein